MTREQRRLYEKARKPWSVKHIDSGETVIVQHSADFAFRYAKVMTRWAELEEEGLVRFRLEDDDFPYDASYVDTWTDKSKAWRERQKKKILDDVRSHGVVGFVGEYRDPTEPEGSKHAWEQGDSLWGLIGNDTDIIRNSQLLDILERTIECLADANLDTYQEHATQAEVGLP